jgi:hypothetical protein
MDLRFKQASPMSVITIDQLVANHKEAESIIAFIDKYIQYAVDTSEYDVVKRAVKAWKEPTHNKDGVDEETMRLLNAKIERLEALYETLK